MEEGRGGDPLYSPDISHRPEINQEPGLEQGGRGIPQLPPSGPRLPLTLQKAKTAHLASKLILFTSGFLYSFFVFFSKAFPYKYSVGRFRLAFSFQLSAISQKFRNSKFFSLSSVVCLLSSALCLLSSVFCPLSSNSPRLSLQSSHHHRLHRLLQNLHFACQRSPPGSWRSRHRQHQQRSACSSRWSYFDLRSHHIEFR